MHEGSSLNSSLREDGKDREGKKKRKWTRKLKEDTNKKKTREEEKEENETLSVKRRYVDLVSAEAFDIFSR